MLKTAALPCPMDVDNRLLDNDRFAAELAVVAYRGSNLACAQPWHPACEPLR